MKNSNLHAAKNDELTPRQRARKKYELSHRKPDEYYLQELRNDLRDWVQIKDFPKYWIHPTGEIYFDGDVSGSLRKKSHFVKHTRLSIGYYKVSLGRKFKLVHRLLAEAFIPNPNNLPEVDHINGDPSDNRLDNLRWVTHKENLNNSVAIQREIKSHTGLISNIKGRKKVWIDKENKKYKMI